MTAVFMLRHPETTWNAAKRYQGRLEAPLSAEGRTQSRLVARGLSGQQLDAVYTSPLGRALYFAREVAEAADTQLIVDQRLTEIGQTPWEGLCLAEIQRRYPDLYEQWYTYPDQVRFPGGESLRDVSDRALSFLAAVFARFPSGLVAVATHSVVVQTVVAAALSLDLRCIHRIRIANAGLTVFCGTELPPSLLTLNSTDLLYRSPVAAVATLDCVSWKGRRVTQ